MVAYHLTGLVRGESSATLGAGGSVLVALPATGFAAELFLEPDCRFEHDLELMAQADNVLLLALYDVDGRELLRVTAHVRHNSQEPAPGSVAVPAAVAATLEPSWQRFAQRVKECLYLAGKVADATGRPPQELFEQVYAQERYAEKAFEEKNGSLYRECFENLGRFGDYLKRLCRDRLPGGDA
jgi:hypothetical protein